MLLHKSARRTTRMAGLGLAALAAAAATPARAQLVERVQPPVTAGLGVEPGVTVLSRLRPDYDYPGVRLGSVMLRPELLSATGYDDNVLGTGRKQGSALQRTRVNLVADAGWGENTLQAGLQLDDNRYLDLPRQSYTNYSATLGGTYALGRNRLVADYTHFNLSQTARDLDAPRLDAPIAYRIDTLNLRADVPLNRLLLSPGLQVSKYGFDDGSVGGQAYRQGYRNRVVVTPELAASYEMATQRSLVGVVRYAIGSYDNRQAGQPWRDYNDTAVLGGIDVQTTGPWRVRLLAGYEWRQFRQTFRTIQEPVAEMRVIWTLSGLTTLTATLARQIADSADETTAGLTTTAARFAIDHELRRNILLHGQASVAVASIGGNGGTQTLYGLGGEATWLINRHARLGFSYDFAARNGVATGSYGSATTGALSRVGGSYTENRFLLQLRFGL